MRKPITYRAITEETCYWQSRECTWAIPHGDKNPEVLGNGVFLMRVHPETDAHYFTLNITQKHQHMLFLTYLWVRTYDGRLFSLRPAEQGKQNMKHTYKHTANRTYIQQKLSRLHCWRRASLHHKNVKQGVVAGVLDESNLSSYVHNKGLSQYFMWPTLHHLTVKLVPATYIWFNLILSSKIKCQVVKRTRDPLLEGFELLSRPSDIRELQPVHYP